MENITDKEYRDLLDNTLINLKMISEIQENDKSYIEDNLIRIDKPMLFQGLTRWYNNYTRSATMSFLDVIIDNVHTIVEQTLSSKNNSFNKEYQNILQKFLIEINGAVKGLGNLKKTYYDDVFVKSKLDIIIDKLNTINNRINESLSIN
jgi:hypothetical protein